MEMGSFAEFIRSFCIVAVSGGIVLLLSPDGSTKKYVKFIISLCMVSALLSAFLAFSESAESVFAEIEIQTESGADVAENDVQAAVVREAKRNMEAEICRLLSANLGTGEEELYIVVEVDGSDKSAVDICAINVFLADMGEQEEARAYLEKMFMGAVKINIMQKG